MRTRGFTLIELTVIIVIIAALGVTAFARLVDGDALEARAGRDELASAFRLAQRYAVTSGCATQVSLAASSYSVLVEDAPCGTGNGFSTSIAAPGSGGSLDGSFSGLSISPAGTHRYDAFGDLVSGGGVITVSGDSSSESLTVHAGSGFVELP